jgi:hypothetical protein
MFNMHGRFNKVHEVQLQGWQKTSANMAGFALILAT